MVRFAKITVVLLDSTVVAYPNALLKEVVEDCLGTLAKRNPILIKTAAKTKLYFNENYFNAWLQKEIDSKELFQKVQVDNLVRNKVVILKENSSVEENHLWLLKGKTCILANDDSFVSEKLDNRFKLAI